MKQQHIQCGDFDSFKEALNKVGVLDGKYRQHTSIINYFGTPVILNENLPSNIALLIDKDGNTLQKYDLSSSEGEPLALNN